MKLFSIEFMLVMRLSQMIYQWWTFLPVRTLHSMPKYPHGHFYTIRVKKFYSGRKMKEPRCSRDPNFERQLMGLFPFSLTTLILYPGTLISVGLLYGSFECVHEMAEADIRKIENNTTAIHASQSMPFDRRLTDCPAAIRRNNLTGTCNTI